jgi:hypothetical protein
MMIAKISFAFAAVNVGLAIWAEAYAINIPCAVFLFGCGIADAFKASRGE